MAAKRNTQAQTTHAKVDNWETMTPLLDAMYQEVRELSKKKPDAVVSKPKVAVVNRILEACREVLTDESSLPFLDILNVDDVPQMSDAVLMLSQYSAAMKAFHERYYGYDGVRHRWFVD